jgi:hypothetical protein
VNRAQQRAVRVRDTNSGRAPAEPDDKLTGTEAAAVAGIKPGTWRSYTTPRTSRGGKRFGPAPDGYNEPCGCPWWWRSTVEAFRDRSK